MKNNPEQNYNSIENNNTVNIEEITDDSINIHEDIESEKTKEKNKQKKKVFLLKKKLIDGEKTEIDDLTTQKTESTDKEIGKFSKIKKNKRRIDLMFTKHIKNKLKIKNILGLTNEKEKKKIKRLEHFEELYKAQLKKMKNGSFKEYENGIFIFQINKGTELSEHKRLKDNLGDEDLFVQLHIDKKRKNKENHDYKNFFNVIKNFAKKFPEIKYAAGESRLLNDEFIEYYKKKLIEDKGKIINMPSIIKSYDDLKPYFIKGTYYEDPNSDGLRNIRTKKSQLNKYVEGYMEKKGINKLPEGNVIIDLDKIRNS